MTMYLAGATRWVTRLENGDSPNRPCEFKTIALRLISPSLA